MRNDQEKGRLEISKRVRELRRVRKLTKTELAAKLGVSQGRLSELERGDGSFTAEQFLTVLRFFNVSAASFVPPPDDVYLPLQNALARLGAIHLCEDPETIPDDSSTDANEAIHAVLVDPSESRLVAALAPVLVRNIDRVALKKIEARLAEVGLGRRLCWVVENTLAAGRRELGSRDVERSIKRAWRRAELLLTLFLEGAQASDESRRERDVFDRAVRSRKTDDELVADSSTVSRRWNVVTAFQVEDFQRAIRAALLPPPASSAT